MKTILQILTSSLLIWTGAAHAAAPAWKQWAESPTRIRVQFKAQFTASSNLPVTLSFNGESQALDNTNSCVATNTQLLATWLRPYQRVPLAVDGLIQTITIQLECQQPLNLDLASSARSRGGYDSMSAGQSGAPVPQRYQLYVLGLPASQVEYTSGDCSQRWSTNWWVELRPKDDERSLRATAKTDDREVAENSAPGDGEFLSIGPAKSGLYRDVSIKWTAGLGRLLGGKAAGRLHLMEMGLSSNIYTPGALFFRQPFTNLNAEYEQVVVITNAAGALAQIRAPQTLAHVVEDTANHNYFDLQFHSLSNVGPSLLNGVYPILVTNPLVVWRFTNSSPGPSNPTALRLEEFRPGGQVYRSEVAFDGSNVWTLTRGQGAEQRVETRGLNITADLLDRYETNIVRAGGPDGAPACRIIEHYHLYEWDYELVGVSTDTGEGVTDIQSFTFYTNASEATSYGKIATIIYPDGYWEKRLYHHGYDYLQTSVPPDVDGELALVLTPWTNSPAHPNDATLENCQAVSYNRDRYNGSMEWGIVTYLRTYGPWENSVDFDTQSSFAEVFEYSGNDLAAGLYRQTSGPHGCYTSTETCREATAKHHDDSGSASCGQIACLLTDFSLGATNTYDLGRFESGHFSSGPGRAWRATARTGEGSMYYRTSELGEHVAMTPGSSTMTCLVRNEGSVVLQERHALVGGGQSAQFVLLTRDYFTNDSLGHPLIQVRIDGASGNWRTIHTWDWQGSASMPGSLLLSETDEKGVETKYTYDSLKRVATIETSGMAATAEAGAQAPVTLVHFYDAMDRVVRRENSAAGLSLWSGSVYDLAGRVRTNTSPEGLVTATTYLDHGRAKVEHQPSGATSVSSNFISRQACSRTGSADVACYYAHSCWPDYSENAWTGLNPKRAENRTFGAPNSSRFAESRWSGAGCLREEVAPGYSGPITNTFTPLTRRYEYSTRAIRDELPVEVLTSGADFAFTNSFTYDTRRRVQSTWTAGATFLLNDRPVPHTNSSDRIWTTNRVSEGDAQNGVFFVTTATTYLTDSNSTPTDVFVERERLSGFAPNVIAEITRIDAFGRSNVQTTVVDRDARRVTVVSTDSASSLAATQVWVNGLLQSESTVTVAAPTRYIYDALRRQVQTLSPLGAVSSTAYDPATGQTLSTTDFAGNTTSFDYYPNGQTGAGQVRCVTRPGGKRTFYAYTNLLGLLTRTWGDVPYPEERVYNEFGEMTELRTFRGGAGWGGAAWPASPGTPDVTRWVYQASTGLLLSKTDATGTNTVSYTYHKNNQLRTLTGARGQTTTYSRADWGDLLSIDMTQGGAGATHRFTIFSRYNRLGLPGRVVEYDAAAFVPEDQYDSNAEQMKTFTDFVYDEAGRVTTQTGGPYGLLASVNTTVHYDPARGRDSLAIACLDDSPIYNAAYGHDAYGRLNSVSNGQDSVLYEYAANSDRLGQTSFRRNGAEVLSTRRDWESGERLNRVENTAGGTRVSSHQYGYDAMQRRARALLEDGSSWRFGYNDRDEVVSARRYWPGMEPVAGQQFCYEYDTIGNRTASRSGGDDKGGGLRAAAYGTDACNQYTNIATEGYKDIVGAALAGSSVLVNGGPATRKGEYFQCEIRLTNSAGPCWAPVSVAVSNAGGILSGARAFVSPPRGQAPRYDRDGNLAFDGVWEYEWDAANRLVQMTMATNVAGLPANERKRLTFEYDYLGRRLRKIVSFWQEYGGYYEAISDQFYLYDGWNVVAVVPTGNAHYVLANYTWGLDLSGSVGGAGGVGGLAVVRDAVSGAAHYPAFDGNGNVTALVSASGGAVSARYEYGPFGEPIRVTGPAAEANPFRWSTKFTDTETGLVYYGYRYYNPGTGRWINRDPLGEEGGKNLCAVSGNDLVNKIDALGQSILIEELIVVSEDVSEKVAEMGRGAGLIARVRDFAERFNNIQDFVDGVSQGGEADITDLLLKVQEAQGALAQGLRGASSYQRALGDLDQGHHMFPGAKRLATFFSDNKIKPNGALFDVNGYLHQYGLHTPGTGGAYNKVWYEFWEKNKGSKDRPYYIIGFGVGLLGRLGFEGAAVF